MIKNAYQKFVRVDLLACRKQNDFVALRDVLQELLEERPHANVDLSSHQLITSFRRHVYLIERALEVDLERK